MPVLRPVTVDLATGVVNIGGTQVTLERDGAHFTAPGGFRARALTFAERSLIIAGALIDPEPKRAVLTKLRAFTAPSHDATDEMSDALILALAGGGEPAASFAECAREACRKQGVDWQTVQQTPAILVDQLALKEDTLGGDDGWTRFEFQEVQEDSVPVEDCCRMMVEQLLERGIPREEATDETEDDGSRWSSASAEFGQLQNAGTEDSSNAVVAGEFLQSQTAVWPRTEQPPRARVRMSPTVEAPEKAARAPEEHSPIGAVLRSTFDRSQGLSRDHAEANQTGEESLSSANKIPVETRRLDWEDVPKPANASTTLRDTATVSPVAKAAAIPAKARLRGHRLRDLPAVSTKTPSIEPSGPYAQSDAVSYPTMSEPRLQDAKVPFAVPQCDWIYEIATALADECDLRGLDA